MRVPVSWLRELVAIPGGDSARDIAERLVRAGFEVEGVEEVGAGVDGPLVIGLVVGIEELTEFKKPIRYCTIDLGDGDSRGVICGARNFAVGDHVVVAPPGTTLPGGFHITARETYGRVSNGMICSERELGLSDSHEGIIVVESGSVGDDAAALLGIGDAVLDVSVTPDRGYALSMRGIAREMAISYGVAFDDPGLRLADLPAPTGTAPRDCGSDDLDACALFTARTIEGFDPTSPTPGWMKQRLVASGMRPVSLAVDVTNYVMLELGQPLHAFDAAKVSGTLRAGWAKEGETLETLDHVIRSLHPGDLTIRDDNGPLGLAGTMGGLHSEIDDATTTIVLEAAWFAPEVIARMARRHRLSSEASRRFERGVDRTLAPYASARATELLVALGGGTYVGMTGVEAAWESAEIRMPEDLPSRIAGCDIPGSIDVLTAVGCATTGAGDDLRVAPPSWRLDMTDPAHCVEEVLRLHGLDRIPSILPSAPSGYGRTERQRLRRVVGMTMAALGCHEVLSYPFVGVSDHDAMRYGQEDARRRVPRLANPLSEETPYLRASLLPGLLAAARRNRGRGHEDLAIWELGRVFLLRDGQSERGASDPVRPGVDRRPSDDELAALEALLPDQPQHIAAVWSGRIESHGWWGPGRAAMWSDAVEAAVRVVEAAGVVAQVRQGSDAGFHPGRTAVIEGDGVILGHAGELHPATCAAFAVPDRTVAFELDLDALAGLAAPVVAPRFSSAPIAKEDIALVVSGDVRVGDLEQTLRSAGGELVEDVRLFDVYEGPQVPDGTRSLAFSVRLRAPDRTLTPEEITSVRGAMIEAAARDHMAVLR